MPGRWIATLRIACVIAAGAVGPAHAQTPIKVVASFSVLADFARNVGGEHVAVTALVAPGGDVHVYTPTPSDAKTLAAAQLLIVNGLGFEGWMPRLVQSAGNRVAVVIATTGVSPLRGAAGHHGESAADPHAWQSVANAKIYVANIRDGLIAADPAGAPSHSANAAAYLQKLDALEREAREAFAAIPAARRKVISTHAAFGYFAAAYGIGFVAPQGVSTESEPTARDVAAIIQQIRAEKTPAVFLENISDPRLMRRIAAESGESS